MKLSQTDLTQLAGVAIEAARSAGTLIMEARRKGVTVEHKAGADTLASQVVTEVDRQAQAHILSILEPTFASHEIALLTEESEDDRSRFDLDHFWCIDPIDGTLPFVRGDAGFAVSIALVARDGTPRVGVVFDPVEAALYHAVAGQGAYINQQPWTAPAPEGPFTLVIDSSFAAHPRSPEVERLLSQAAPDALRIEHGGAVMNAIRVIQQAPAAYFKFPKPTRGGGSLWDFAATACIYHELGAVATDWAGGRLDLNRPDSTYMNHRGALYASDPQTATWIRELLNLSTA